MLVPLTPDFNTSTVQGESLHSGRAELTRKRTSTYGRRNIKRVPGTPRCPGPPGGPGGPGGLGGPGGPRGPGIDDAGVDCEPSPLGGGGGGPGWFWGGLITRLSVQTYNPLNNIFN